MIVDLHTHVFPPEIRDQREAYLARDAGFRELYSSAKAQIATAEELLASMEAAGVDVSVICGFSWSDAELCRLHSEYLLDAAKASGGRLIPFCTLHPSDESARAEIKRCAARGARGLGELRPVQQGYGLVDTEEADLLAWGAEAYDLALLFHASEPVGHAYPGKAGLPIEQLGRFLADFPNATVIAAHWGGGLPFYTLMPEMGERLATAYVDTAASRLLYDPRVYQRVIDLLGAERILFGSDFPLVPQKDAIEEVRRSVADEGDVELILGGNAERLLRLSR